MDLAAIGGDTYGSTRLPAIFCGLIGRRVIPGRFTRDGMSALLMTLDTPGPMCKNVEDTAKILDVLFVYDKRDDLTSINPFAPEGEHVVSTTPFSDAIAKPKLKGRKIGVLSQVFGTHKGIRGTIDETLRRLDSAGMQLIDVEIASYLLFTSVLIPIGKGRDDDYLGDPELSVCLEILGVPFSEHRNMNTAAGIQRVVQDS